MGVVSVHHYAVPEGKNAQQLIDILQQRLELLGGSKSAGTFTVDCETYYSAPHISPSRIINIIHDSERPASVFALLDTGTCLVADNTFDLLMVKLAGVYSPKKQTRIEAKGPRYALGDFKVKIGSVSMGPSFRGILLEVEYGSCSVPSMCWGLISEFIQSFTQSVTHQLPHPYLQARMSKPFAPEDTVHQYMEHFNNFRKSFVPAAPTASPAVAPR